ncbi:MAG TPA: hypothetical protein VLA43_01665 [Longimicrobiales bacterium]|nr:hypothetical protein [Longimicrobiales bacterium]
MATFLAAAGAVALSPPSATAQPTARPAHAPETGQVRLVTPAWLAQSPPRLATGTFTKSFFRVVTDRPEQVAVHQESLLRLQGPRDTLYLRVQERQTAEGVRLDSLLFRARDLVPEPNLLEGFDEANLDLVCVALAQRGTGEFLVPTVSRPSGEEVTYRVHVGEPEVIGGAGGPVSAVRVVYMHPSGQAGTFWVDTREGAVVLEGAQLGNGTTLYAVAEPSRR